MEPPRSAQQRRSDTLSRLAADIDAWIATGDTAGDGYLVRFRSSGTARA